MDHKERSVEWNETKRKSTLLKHGIDFEDAAEIFKSPHVIMEASNLTEERYRAVGPLGGIFFTVVFTIRGDAYRIITARRARHGEIRKYHESHAL